MGSTFEEQLEAPIIGIDVGATKTEVVLLRPASAARHLVVETNGWRTGTTADSAPVLARLIVAHFGEEVTGFDVGVGSYGCNTTEQCRAVELILGRTFHGRVEVRNDGELMPLALEIDDGIGLVSGTGAVGVARDADGSLMMAGGWGWVMGDEGGASGIVREAVRAVLRQDDEGEAPDALAHALRESFGVPDVKSMAMSLTRSDNAADFGKHAQAVFAVADESAIARSVIIAAGRHLAELIFRLRRRGSTATVAVAGGTVIRRQAALRAAFEQSADELVPDVRVRILEEDPVLGALYLASRLSKKGLK
jgi:glucosamine kinase